MIVKNTLFYYSLLLYLASMFLPVSGFHWDFLGFQAFILSCLGLIGFEDFMTLPCLANITYILSILLRDKNISIRILMSLFTLVFGVFAIGFFLLLPEDKGIFSSYIGPGLLTWFLSFALMLVSQIKEYKKAPKRM